MFSHVYLFVFRNDYEISGDRVFLFFYFEKFNPHHQTQWKSKLLPFQQNYLHSICLVVQNLKLVFFLKEISKKCTSFEEQKGTSLFLPYCINSLSSIKSCLKFLLICFVWEIKGFYQISGENEGRNEVDFTDMI